MKFTVLVVTLFTLTFATHSHAQSWLDDLKSLFGLGQEAAQPAQPNANEMVSMLTNQLGVNSRQAEGGLGSLFNYVKGNLSDDKFSQLTDSLPGVNQLIQSAPDVSQLKSAGGLSGLMDKAAQYNDSLKAINEVKKQFDALGLEPAMIMQYIEQAKQYLDTEQGQQAKQLLMQGLSNMLEQS